MVAGFYDFGAVIKSSLWILVVAGAGACASPLSTVRDDNRRLTASVSELRVDRRSQDRKIKDLEQQLALAKETAPSELSVPTLPIEVVKANGVIAPVAPDGARVVAVADDGSEIVYEGDAALGKAATFDDDATTALPKRPTHAAAPVGLDPLAPVPEVSTSDRLEVTRRVPIAARATRAHVRADRDTPTDRTGDAGVEYRAAVELVKQGNYADALTALHAFIAHYPHHDYADNAQYWIGEAFYAQKDFDRALVEFRATIETYPRGNKVPDSLLKVGYCYFSLGQPDKARAVLQQVVTLYPKSEPAALAAKRLESP